jgi:hypothetical protein
LQRLRSQKNSLLKELERLDLELSRKSGRTWHGLSFQFSIFDDSKHWNLMMESVDINCWLSQNLFQFSVLFKKNTWVIVSIRKFVLSRIRSWMIKSYILVDVKQKKYNTIP